MKNFKSDNYFGVHPSIFDAMIAANEGAAGSYGHDKYTEELQETLARLFEHDVTIFLASTGTISNCLCLSSICPSYGTVYCTKEAHINNDECNAPGFFLCGAKMMCFTSPSAPSKIDLKMIDADINWSSGNVPHTTRPACITVTQSTELGQIYTIEELGEIGRFAHEHHLKLHMDGARFANALVGLSNKLGHDVRPAEMTWKVGVDVLSFGCTKNGGLMGEVIVFFDKEAAKNFEYLHKRSGQLLSKTRFFAAQVLGYLKDNLWLDLAKHSNAMAKKLEEGLRGIKQLEITMPVEANELFVKIPSKVVEKLWQDGFEFYIWDAKEGSYRLVTSWATKDEAINEFVAACKKHCESL